MLMSVLSFKGFIMKTAHESKIDFKKLTKYTNDKIAITISAVSVINSIYESVGTCAKCKKLNTNECPISRAIMMEELNHHTFYCADYEKAR